MTGLSMQWQHRAALVCGLCSCVSELAQPDVRHIVSTQDKLGAQDRCGWGAPGGQMGDVAIKNARYRPLWALWEWVGTHLSK